MRLNIYFSNFLQTQIGTSSLFLCFTLLLGQFAWANDNGRVPEGAYRDHPGKSVMFDLEKLPTGLERYSGSMITNSTENPVTTPTLQARWNISHGPWTIGSSIDVCKGTKIVFSGNPSPTGGTYNWTGPNGFSSTSAEPYIIDIQPNEAGTYKLVYTVGGQSASVSFSVTVRNPTVNLGADKTTCAGSSVTITSSITGSTSPYTYAWSTGATSSSITVNPSSVTTYSLTVTDSKGCQDSDDIVVNVNSRPVLECEARVDGSWRTLPGCSVSVCQGVDLALSVNPQLSTVTWTGPGGFTASGNDAFITSSYTSAKAGSYVATLTDANGCSASKTISVSTAAGPTLQARWNISHGPWTSGSSISVCKGTKIVFSGNPSPTGGTYVWTGPAGFSSTSAEPYIIDIQPSQAGTYTLEYTKDGCSSTVSFTVSVGSVTVNLGADKTNCLGSSVTISGSITGGTSPYTYAWSTGAASSSISVSPSAATTYALTVTDSKGCNDSDDIIVTPLPKPTATTADKTICAGSSTTLTVSASGGTSPYTYLWSTGATTTSISVSPGSTASYSVTVTDSKGCTGTDNATVTVNPKPTVNITKVQCALILITYSVELTTTGNQVTSTAGTVTNNGGGSYTISNINAGTNITITSTNTTTGCKLDVPVTAPSCLCPTVSAPVSGGNKTICNGQTIPALTVTVGSGETADWYSAASGGTLLQSGSLSYTPTAAGTYYALARNSTNNCTSNSRTGVTLTINPKPTASISGPAYFCPSQSITLTASGGGTYSWSTGATSASISVSTAGTYTVTVTSNGCTDVASKTVSQGSAVNAGLTKNMDWTCTSGDMPATLTATPTGGGYSYSWSSGAVPVAGTNTAKVAEAGQFFVTVTNTTTGCTGVASVTVVEDKTAPSASLSASNEISCANPSATLTALPTGMQYQWSAGASPIAGTNRATVTASGNYTVTVTNPSNGCSNIAVTNVQQSNLSSITASISGNTNICAGNSTTLTAGANGSGPFTYLWSTGSASSSITVSPSNTTSYSVTVSSGTCSDAASATVTVNPKPTASAGSDQSICAGTSAALSASASGGTSPYTYAWSTGANTASTSVATAGTYTVTVTDSKGCTDTDDMVVTVNPKPTANAGSDQSICAGTSASLSASASGGTSPYSYAWSNGANTASTSVSTAGTYTVTVTDSKGCTHTDQVVVSISPSLNANAGTDQAICTGASAALSASASGGTGPYSYAWSNGANTASTSASTAGTYTVTVTDSKGCTGVDQVVVTVNPKPTANAGTDQSICAGTSASLSASASGGTSPYTYAWSTGANTASTSVSAAGTYTVTVTDSKGCTDTDDMVVTVNPKPTANAGTDQSICAGTSASLSASASGGTGPYSYAWSNGANTASTSVSTAGTYTVTVTDSKGCSHTDQVVVSISPSLNANAGTDQTICTGASAALSASASGGTGPYSYAWSNGANTASTSVSTAGTYTVTVTDSKGCTGVDQVVVTVNPKPTANAGTDQSICAGTSASLGASASGGTGPYTYAWSTGANTASTSVATAGTYTVTVTDSKGCTDTDDIVVTVNPKPTANAGSDQSICAGSSASLSASASGGTGPYSYAWSNGANTASTSVSTAGTYTVTVTDSKGCSHTDQVVVSISPSLNANAGTDQTICTGASAALSASASGGTGPYSYAWSNGANTASTSVSTAGTYTVTVTDSKGCTGVDQVVVTVNPKPTANAGTDQSICAGTSASLGASASGGTGPYSYAWSNGANTASTSVTTAGTYTVTVTDSKGCTDTDDMVVTVNPKPTANAGTDQSICAGTSASLSASASGGTGPYSYAWSNGANTASTSVSTAGTYTVTVTDSKGCTDTDDMVVTVNPKPTANAGTDQSICAGTSASLSASASGGTGPYTYAWSNGANTASTSVSPGTTTTYSVTVTDSKGCSHTDQVVVSISPSLNANAGTDQSICAGTSASLSASASGGTGPYSYAWSNGANTASTSVSTAGTYTVTVTDSKGCTGVDQVVVTVNPKPTANAGTDQSICAGTSASLGASASGGTGPYSYAWSNGANTASTSVSTAGTYTITVTDSKGCTDTDDIVVTINPKPTANAGSDQSICAGSSASLSASASGGTGPYSYAWSNGANTASTSVSTAGTYTVTVTDSKGCSHTDQVVVSISPSLNANAGTDQTICTGASAALSASASGGTGPYSYAWSNGANTASTSVSTAGTYTVTVTDSKGCTGVDQVVVTVNPKPTANAGTDQSICAGTSASLGASASGGTGPYSYAWSNGANTASTSVTTAGTYTVTVTDSKGCTDTDDMVVTVNPKPTANAGTDQSICAGTSASLSASASGGTGPYSYAWSNGANTASTSVSTAGTYTVTVTDSKGCTHTDQVVVSISPSLNANAGNDQTICIGASAALSASASGGTAPYSYTWSNGANTASTSVSPNTTTTYSVTITDSKGCTGVDQVVVTVNPKPTASAGTDQSICAGTSASLSASASGGTGPYSYAWSNGANTASTSVSSAGTYTVTVTDSKGCTDTDDMVVTVTPRPNASAGPDRIVCAGTSTSLTATGGVSFSWSNGATTGSITVSPNNSTTYTVTVTDINGCQATDQAVVTVNPIPTADAGTNKVICSGESVTLSASANGGTPGYSFFWSTGQNTSSVVVTPTTTTTYNVTVTDSKGCEGVDNVVVTVNPKPAANAGPDQANCEGTTFALNGKVTGGTAPYSFAWSTGANTADINVTPSSTTTYILTVTDATGCKGIDEAVVTVYKKPAANAGSDQSICYGQSATLNATANDGLPPYSFAWNTGATTATVSVSPTQNTTYTVTITDNRGCFGVDQTVVSINPQPAVNAGADRSICLGQSTSLTASASSGTPGYTYAWSNGANTASTSASPGTTTTYSVTVTDSKGCTAVDQVVVTVNPAPIANAGTDQTICAGQTANLSASASGGTPGYTYNWSNGANTASTTVSPGATTTYAVTVTDSKGCTATDQVVVSISPSPVANAGSNQTICNGASVSLSASASGGTTPYTYAWSNGATTASTSASPTTTTTYTVTVTDGKGCMDTDEMVVTVNPNPVADAGADKSICVGASTTISASATGGMGPYTYKWSTGATTASTSVSPTVATTYTVTVTDNKGCTDTDEVAVKVNAKPTVDLNLAANAPGEICVGGSTSITTSVSGGTTPYTFAWSNGLGNQASHTVSPTTTTSYSVTVTDNNGCSNSDNITIVVNPLPVGNAGVDQAVCQGVSASLNASATGGTAPYSYAWSNGANTASTTVNPASTTTYSVTVTDAKGCQDADDLVLTINPNPTLTITKVECAPNLLTYTVTLTSNGTQITASSGTVTNTGSNTYTVSGIASGVNITVTATFTATNCKTDGSVNAPNCSCPAVTPPVSGGNKVICEGESIPSLSATVGANTTIDWYSAAGNLLQSGSLTFTPTAAGTYYAEARSTVNGCVSSTRTSITLTINPQPVANAGSDQSICSGNSASLQASATSGTGPYTYKWSSGQSTAAISVSPGSTTTYSVTVTDNKGCTDVDEVVVTVNPLPVANAGQDQEVCFGTQANLSASATNGTAPYSYAWSSGLGAGATKQVTLSSTTTFVVTVTDSKGCTDTDNITVTVNPLPIANAGSDQEICSGLSANLLASASAGTAPFNYKWSSGQSSAGISVSPNTTTTYTVTVTDAKGCTAVDQVVVKVNPPVLANAGSDQEVCVGSSAALSASGSNGTAPYTYKWSSGQATASINVSPSTTTTYTVTVTDSKGCEDTDEVVVRVNPNPIANAGSDQAICAGTTATLSASASNGTGGYTYKWSNGATTASTTVTPGASTTYTVTVTDGKGCEDTDEVAITINPNLVVSAGTDGTICAGETQNLTATVSSGTPAFSYSWSSGQATASINVSPTATTTYRVTVTDSKGCTGTDQVVVTVNPKPSVSLGPDQEICAGSSTTLSASPSGGTPAYTYAWNTGGTTASITASPVATATYTVTITDAKGCVAQDNAVVKVNPNPIADAGSDKEICNGSSASLSASASAGTAPFTYRWSNGATTASTSVSPSSTTTYTVTVTDSKGCTDTDELVVTVNPNPVANAGADATVCAGESARLRASASSGTPSYTFNWSNGLGAGVQHDVSPAVTTTYTVTVTDSKGCSSVDQVVVRVNSAPVANAGNDVTICTGGNATLTASASQGTPSYTYAWSTGAPGSSVTVSPTANTTYTVTVTDANQCSDVDEVVVRVNPLPTLTVSNKVCAPNLLTYTVSINTNADVVASTAGSVVNTGSGSFNITNISAGENIVITVTNSQTGCKTTLSVTAPNCSCPVVNAPVSGGNRSACEGETLPALTVTVKSGETADWYNASGTLLSSGSTSFTPSAAGTYYAEARNTTTNCKSATRTAVSLSIRPATPSANLRNGEVCSEDSPHTIPSDNAINLNTLITSGYTGGTWSTSTPGVSLSGSVFTAKKAQEGQTVTFTYKITGVDGPGNSNCNDRVYTVSVTVNSCYAKLGDLVWEDLNRNGIQDGGERLISGVTVRLYNSANTLIATTTTNVNGEYLFDFLYPTTYIVEFVKPSGYEPTTQNVGDDAQDSDAGSNGRTGPYTLEVGDDNRTVDAGFYKPASLGDYVWFDQNGNGTQDGNEPGIPGVTVTLYADTNGDGTPDGAPLKSTTTSGSGRYEFTNLTPGTYIVNFGKPSGYDPVAPDQGGNDAIDSDANPTTGNSGPITLVSGQHNPTIDAGFGQYDLALRKGLNSGTPGPFTQGSTVKFDIRVTNEGSVAAKNVVVTDRFPTGLNFSGLEPGSSGAISNGAGVVTIPTINPGQTVTFTIVSTIAANFQGSSLTNKAEITTDDGNDKDSTPNNDTPSEDDQDDETILINQQGRIDVEKLVNNRDADTAPGVTIFVPDAGATVTWTYVVTNTGTLNLTNINVVDDKEGPVCTIAALAPGQSSTCTLSRPAKLGPYVNEATATGQPVDNTNTPVGSPVSDKDPANYTGVFINIDKEADKTLICAGEKVEFSLTMRMKGGAPGFQFRNIRVTDNNLSGTLTPSSPFFRPSSDANSNGFLDFGEEFVWVYSKVINSTLTNTAMDMAEVWAPDADNPNLIVKVGEIGATDQVTVEVNNSQCAELGDYVWEDLDTDGIQDSNEKGVPGVTVKLYDSSNTQVGTTITDANGRYLFTGLVPETYHVEFVLPSGYTRTTADQGSDDAVDSDANTSTGQTGTYPLNNGDSNLTVDAGIYRSAQLGDRVWEDKNANGVQDDGEPGISGVTVKLLDSNGSTIATDITDASGLYEFTNLKPGTYTVMVNIPGGYTPTGQNQGGDDSKDSDINPGGMTGPIVLKSGDNDKTNDAGLYRPATLGDYVWNDLNRDGMQNDNELGISGITVTLLDKNGNTVATKTTDGSGKYEFTNLAPGDYQVVFGDKTGLVRTQPNQGDDAKDSDADLGSGKTGIYTLASGETNRTVDAGYYEVTSAIGDYVWEDLNRDGIQDSNEPGIDGVTVNLLDANGNVIKTTVTAGGGAYLFTNLPSGTYSVEFVKPAGYTPTTQDAGNDARDSDANNNGKTGAIILPVGGSNLTIDAGFYRPASLGDYVWLDKDGDGYLDIDEVGVPGVQVQLMDASGKVLATTTTDDKGFYIFTDLAPGQYKVTFILNGQYVFTAQNAVPGDDFRDSDADPKTGMTGLYDLSSGEKEETVDAGIYLPAKIGDFVWIDTDKDGIQDADEKGVEGVSVRLTSNRFAGQEVTTTDANGMYMFSNLRPGDYQVEFVLPNGYTRSTANQGADDSKDSDADVSTGKTGTYTLTSGQYNSTVDAGIYSSAVCAINAVVSNVTCDNKGTATPSDDTYSFTLTVSGSNAGTGWKATIFGQQITGNYGQAVVVGPRLISQGGGQFTVTDASNATCTSSTSVTAPLPCSTPSDLNLAKSFVSATAQPNGSYNVVYTITVSAPAGSLSSTYDLSDQPAFDNDVTINSASYTSSVAAGGNLTGTGPWTLANDQAISASQTHTYTLTVNVSLRLTDATGDNIYTKCGQATPNAPKAGEGLFNRALLDVNNDGTPDKEATACGDLPECQLTARVSNVTCDNKGTATPSDDTYSFTLTVTGSNASTGWKATIFGQQVTGSYGQAVVVGPRLISQGGGQFTVTDASNTACAASASVTAPLPCSTPSELTLVKTFVNATAQPNGSYNVVYNIAVGAPAGSLATTYDLSDQPAFDNDVVINSAAFASTVSAGGNLTGTGPWTLANDQAISGGQTHTYTLTVNVSLRLTDTAGDNIYTKCGQSAPGAPKAGEGLFNRALLDVNNDGTPDKEATACGDLPECQLTAQVSNVTCDNKGTPTPSDDTYSFSLIVTGSNASSGWKGTIFGQQVSGSYGQSVSVGPILISQGGGQFTVTDASNSACTASARVTAPTACSQLPCEIKAVVSEVSCDGLGTKDTLDDVYTFRMLVTGTGTDWEATINGKVIEGNYNKVVVLGPYKISAGALSFSVKDADNANCVTDPITVFPPKPCSGNTEPCNIGQAELLNVVCNPMGTLSDPSDDTYTFELKISGKSSTNRWVAADGKNTTGTYGQIVKFGPFLIKDGDQTFLISDAGNPECKATVYVPAPKACSNECAVKAEVKNILCSNNGTPENNDDDTFTFELTVTGNNASTGWIANDPNLTTGEYGKTVKMGPYRIKTNATVKFGIFDQLRFNSCTTEVTVTAPAACSSVPKCEIVTKIQNAKCSSNGTPDDPSDDTFTFEVIVTGKNAGNKGWKAEDNKRSIGDYGQVVKFGPYRIADGQVSFKVRDAQDTTCYTLLLVGVPDECSRTCAIKATVVDVKVNNKGTADPKDDTFTFTVKVDGRHSSAAWTANDGTLSPIRGFYGTTLEFGPYPVSGGAKTVNFRDLLDAECRTSVTVEPPVNQGLPECPEDIDLVRKTRTGQIFTGSLDTNDKNFSDLGKECWLPKFALPAGKRYYETQTFSTDTARKQKYTFVLLTNMLTTDKVPGVPAGAPDAHGAVFLGNEYDRALACGDVALPCNNPLSYEVLEGTLRLVVPGYPSETWKMAMQFSAELDSNSTYTLLATTLSPEKTGGYVWVVYNEVTGKHLVLNPTTRKPYPSQALVFERDILCSDLSEIFNVAESMEYLGKPKKTETCAEIDEVTIKDRLLSGGECAADTIVREFTIYHVDSTINYCSQRILIAKPSFKHLSQPLCNYTFECNELDKIKLDRNGNPHPQVTGYPFVVSAFGTHNLDSTYCNLKATYRDSIVDVICAGSYVIRRTWSITDKCYPDSILHFEQHIKVGDFTAPVVECAVGKEYCYCPSVGTDVMMFSADPFDCAANIDAPLPLVKDACSDSLYIVTEILKINSRVIRNSQGQPIDTVETTVVIDTLLPGESRKLTGYNFGDYYFRYTVTDGCGNQTLKLCRFRVADLEAPIAICIDKPNFSLGSSGLARAYVRHIDWGSYDNCGIAKINVRRLHIYNTQTGEKLDRPYYSAWGPYVEFNCYDAQGDGLVEVEMEVIDSSGNRNMCWTRVLVEDKIAPICGSLADKTMDCAALPIGFNPFDIKRLEQIFGIAQVQDNCEGTARELTPLVGKTKEGYCLITRRFIAKDIHGNVSRDTFKQRIVLTTKNGTLCEVCDAKPFVNGVVRTEWGEPVEFVEVYLSGDEHKDMKTNIKGRYEFNPLKPNHHYTITPLYDDGHRNGLSTLDAYLIQRYLLGENTLNSPYKLLAADVDNNGKITSMDITELRRLILADVDFFKSNTSWRFVDSTYRFANVKAPWKEAYPEVIGIDNLERALLGLNFVGIKVGDVNESVQPNSNTAATPRSMGSNFELKALDQYLKAGNTYEVALSAADLAKLKGYQFTLEFDPTALQLADVVYGLAKTENISVRHAGQGMITTSWNALQGLAGNSGALFTLKFKAIADGQLSDLLKISSKLTQAEAYDENLETMNVKLKFDELSTSKPEFVLYQNAPNPFNEATIVRFHLSKPAAGSMRFFDAQGRMLYTVDGEFKRGLNEVSVTRENLQGASGLLLYTLEVDGKMVTKKMNVLK